MGSIARFSEPAVFGAVIDAGTEGIPMKWVKRLFLALVVIFALFYLITRPEDAAGAVKAAVGAVWGAVRSIGTFFTSLAS